MQVPLLGEDKLSATEEAGPSVGGVFPLPLEVDRSHATAPSSWASRPTVLDIANTEPATTDPATPHHRGMPASSSGGGGSGGGVAPGGKLAANEFILVVASFHEQQPRCAWFWGETRIKARVPDGVVEGQKFVVREIYDVGSDKTYTVRPQLMVTCPAPDNERMSDRDLSILMNGHAVWAARCSKFWKVVLWTVFCPIWAPLFLLSIVLGCGKCCAICLDTCLTGGVEPESSVTD